MTTGARNSVGRGREKRREADERESERERKKERERGKRGWKEIGRERWGGGGGGGGRGGLTFGLHGRGTKNRTAGALPS